MKPAIIMEMACTSHVCGPMLAELWPDPATRPYLVQESVSGFSAAHKSHFQAIAAANGGRMIMPILQKRGVPVSDVSEVALVGFSAGCWGVAEMLADPDAAMVSAAMCVDGLHYPTGSKFEAFAKRAAASGALLVDLYSAIPVTGYSSTRDSARRLAGVVGASQVDPLLPGSDESFATGHFYAVGFPGSDKQAHVRQVQTYQPMAWEAFFLPWLGSRQGPGFTGSKLPTPGTLAGSVAPSGVSAAAIAMFVLGAASFVVADRMLGITEGLTQAVAGSV